MFKRKNKIIGSLLFLTMCISLVPNGAAFAKGKSAANENVINSIESKSSPSNITLSSTSLTMVVGTTAALTTNVITNKVIWQSSNPYVATVDENGVITARDLGTVTITCTTGDGSGQSASCLVTINPYTQSAENEVKIGLESNPTTGYQWVYSINDPNIINMVSKDYTLADPNPKPGCGGTDVYTFKGLAEGSTTVTFKYLQPWSNDTFEVKTFKFTVDKNLKINVELIPNKHLDLAFGDVNHDGKVNLLDSILLKRYIYNNSINIDKDSADINHDGKINLADYILLKKSILKK